MLAALALTAVTASNAQASGNGLVLRNLQSITTFPVAVAGHYGAGQMLFLGLTIECVLAEITGKITSATHGQGTALLKGCKFPESEVCLIANTEILSNTILVELLLLGTIARAKPTGTSWGTVTILSHEEECSLIAGHSSVLSLTGSACVEIKGDLIDSLGGGGESAHCTGLKLGANKVTTHGPPALAESSGLKFTTHA
jgi:hypothetical protein